MSPSRRPVLPTRRNSAWSASPRAPQDVSSALRSTAPDRESEDGHRTVFPAAQNSRCRSKQRPLQVGRPPCENPHPRIGNLLASHRCLRAARERRPCFRPAVYPSVQNFAALRIDACGRTEPGAGLTFRGGAGSSQTLFARKVRSSRSLKIFFFTRAWASSRLASYVSTRPDLPHLEISSSAERASSSAISASSFSTAGSLAAAVAHRRGPTLKGSPYCATHHLDSSCAAKMRPPRSTSAGSRRTTGAALR